MCVYYGIPQQPCVCTVGSRNNHVCVLWDPATTTCVYYGIPQQTHTITSTRTAFFSGQAFVREYWPGDQESLGTFVRKRIRHPVFGEMNRKLIVGLGLEGGLPGGVDITARELGTTASKLTRPGYVRLSASQGINGIIKSMPLIRHQFTSYISFATTTSQLSHLTFSLQPLHHTCSFTTITSYIFFTTTSRLFFYNYHILHLQLTKLQLFHHTSS